MMKPQVATTISQSQRLLSCGVDPKTADMVWLNRGKQPYFLSFNEGCNRAIPEVGDVPAWSLSALLGLLPESIKKGYSCYDLELSKTTVAYRYYADMDCYLALHEEVSIYADTPIEACVQMIEWLTANGYSLNKIEE